MIIDATWKAKSVSAMAITVCRLSFVSGPGIECDARWSAEKLRINGPQPAPTAGQAISLCYYSGGSLFRRQRNDGEDSAASFSHRTPSRASHSKYRLSELSPAGWRGRRTGLTRDVSGRPSGATLLRNSYANFEFSSIFRRSGTTAKIPQLTKEINSMPPTDETMD